MSGIIRAKRRNAKSRALAAAKLLPPVQIPQAEYHPETGEWYLDVAKMGNDIQMYVYPYGDESENDLIRMYVGSTMQPQHCTPPFTQFKFDRNEFPDDVYDVYYTVTELIGNSSTSESLKLRISHSTSQKFPPPTFPLAVNGTLQYSNIRAHGGTLVRVFYPGMNERDQIRVHWYGTDFNGVSVRTAEYDSSWVSAGLEAYLDINIPEKYVLALGNSGAGAAYYEVIRSQDDPRYPGRSLEATVLISWEDISQLRLSATSMAPHADPETLPNLSPYNVVTVFGPPGLDVVMAASPEAEILDADHDGSRNKTVTLNDEGLASIKVRLDKWRDPGHVIVVAAQPADELIPVEATPLVFVSYLFGSAGIECYRHTTNALTLPHGQNSVYVKVDKKNFPTAKLQIRIVEGIARINDIYSQAAEMATYNDGCATFNVSSTQPGRVALEMMIKDGPGVGARLEMEFTDFPYGEAQ